MGRANQKDFLHKKTVKVGNVKYKVLFDCDDVVLQGDEGACFNTPPRIYISPNAPCYGEVLLEEIMHAIQYVFGENINITKKNHSRGVELLYMVLADNKLITF